MRDGDVVDVSGGVKSVEGDGVGCNNRSLLLLKEVRMEVGTPAWMLHLPFTKISTSEGKSAFEPK